MASTEVSMTQVKCMAALDQLTLRLGQADHHGTTPALQRRMTQS